MTTTVGATPKQTYWIGKCLQERQVPPALVIRAQQPLSKKDASALLTSLFECPKAKAGAEVTATGPAAEGKLAEPGYYVVESTTGEPKVYVVVEGKNKRRVAKELHLPFAKGGRATWIYAKGMVYRLAEQAPVTVQQAASFGHLHGWCICCGKPLDVPLSVQAGIGPVCVKKHFGMTQMQFLLQQELSVENAQAV